MALTFEQLQLARPLLRAVAEAGYTTPSPIQAQAIPPVLQGKDLMGCAQTGTGKTAAFALPMLQRLAAAPARRPGAVRALILTPTRELALQIGDNFAAYGKYLPLRHTVVFGGVGQAPQAQALRQGVDILIACPGRLNDLLGQGIADLAGVEIFVLDEADRMLDMGFVHDVKKVIARLPARRQNLMFSATMPREIEQLAASILRQPVFVKVDPVSSTVERISQQLYFVSKADKRRLLPWLIQNLAPPVQNALVFSRTKHGADRIAKDLVRQGIPAAAIHGNKSQNARVAALQGFKAGRTRVLVATDIAARGIDISELSHVFNYDLPEVPETYVHRIGRTARAGADGVAISFCTPEEREYLAGIEKLNRRQIPVVQNHPWAQNGADAAAAQSAAAPLPRKEEKLPMEEKQKPNAPRAEKGRDTKRRGRRGSRRSGQEEAGRSEAAAPQALPARAPVKFDPHFLTAPEDTQARQATRAEKAGRNAKQGRAQPPAAAEIRFQSPAAEKAQAANRPAPRSRRADPRAAENRARAEKNSQRQGAKAGAQQPPQPEKAEPAREQKRESWKTDKADRAAKAEPARADKTGRTRTRPARRPAREEDAGLTLISRRPPQQKFASFEEYMAAHGGATAPIEDHSEE